MTEQSMRRRVLGPTLVEAKQSEKRVRSGQVCTTVQPSSRAAARALS
mgnify:CR=1 FL=1